jgi:hypothetical protein
MLRWRGERDGCGESKRGARGSATGCEGGLKRLNRRPRREVRMKDKVGMVRRRVNVLFDLVCCHALPTASYQTHH